MKIISVQQPWAWLLARRIKRVENRTWWTSYRGEIGIHAGKTLDVEALDLLRMGYAPGCGFDPTELPETFLLGGLVGVANLVETTQDIHHELIDQQQRECWCDPIPDTYYWIMEGAREVPFIPMRGRLGLFEANVNIQEARHG